MNPDTEELIIYEYGYGVRHSNAPNANDRSMNGFDNLASVIRSRIEEMALNEEIGAVNRDLLGALLNEIDAHKWKMLAINLFNKREAA